MLGPLGVGDQTRRGGGRKAAPAACALIAAVTLAAAAGPTPAVGAAKGAGCYAPFRVSYVHGRVVGDTGRIALRVQRRGSRYSISWRALGHTRFCEVTLVEGRGQKFTSRNPASKFEYTDYTTNHSNGIKSLTATGRAG